METGTCEVCGRNLGQYTSENGYSEPFCLCEDEPDHQLKRFLLRIKKNDFAVGDGFWIGNFSFEVIDDTGG